MKIACGWDHRGRRFAGRLREILEIEGHELIDMGAATRERTDYPDYAFQVAEAVAAGEADYGILVCGTGIGMAIAANKVKGVRAGVVHDVETARLSRAHNDSNVLCLSERTAASALLEPIVKTWLDTPFDGGRHAARIEKIMKYDREHACRNST